MATKKKTVSEDSKESKKKVVKAPVEKASKPAVKKAAKKVAAPKAKGKGKGKGAKAPVAPKGKGAYHLTVAMNEEVFETDTDDIATSIMELKPGHLKTKVIIKVKFKDLEGEFVLFNVRAKRIFINRMAAEFFAKNAKLAVNGN